MENTTFEKKVKPFLLWMGTIVSAVMAVAYIIVVFVLINGFKVDTLLNTSVFSIVTAIIGFCIMQMLKIQGQAFAQQIPGNKKISDEYHKTKTKDKKSHSMKYYWITSGARDILIKCLTLGLTSVGMVYIMIEGSGDYSLFLLAGVNLLMFAGFGLISLVKTYDFYNDFYVPFMLERIAEAKQDEKETESSLAVVEKELTEQRDDSIHIDRGSDILDSSVDTSLVSDNNE